MAGELVGLEECAIDCWRLYFDRIAIVLLGLGRASSPSHEKPTEGRRAIEAQEVAPPGALRIQEQVTRRDGAQL
jgi:hypothetical protein